MILKWSSHLHGSLLLASTWMWNVFSFFVFHITTTAWFFWLDKLLRMQDERFLLRVKLIEDEKGWLPKTGCRGLIHLGKSTMTITTSSLNDLNQTIRKWLLPLLRSAMQWHCGMVEFRCWSMPRQNDSSTALSIPMVPPFPLDQKLEHATDEAVA